MPRWPSGCASSSHARTCGWMASPANRHCCGWSPCCVRQARSSWTQGERAMSLILDALRKSDRERQRNAAERLREGPQPAGVSAPPAWMMPLLLAALLTSLSALAWAILSQDQPLTGNQAGQPGEKVENNAPRGAVRPLGAELARARPASAPPSTDTAGGATVETATD